MVFGIIVVVWLMVGGAELNLAAKGRKADQFHGGGGGRGIERERERERERDMKCGWLKRTNSVLDIKSINMDQMNDTMKIFMEEQERIKGQGNSWETKLRKMEEEHNFMDEWRQRNSLLIYGIKECPQESYSYTSKITEYILRMKLKVDILSWHIQ